MRALSTIAASSRAHDTYAPAFRAAVLLAACLLAATALAQKPAAPAAPKPPTNDDCLACHGDASATGANGRSVAVLPDKFGASIHGQAGIACVDCHADLAKTDRVSRTPRSWRRSSCATCHDAAAAQYDVSVHAAGPAGLAAERRGGLQGLPRHARHPPGVRPGLADLSPEPAGHLRPLPRQRGHHPARADRHRQRRRAVPGQHPRAGAVEERPDGGARLQGLPPRARHQAQDRPGEPGVPDDDSGHVRQVPRGGGAPLPDRRARRGARQGAARRAGLRHLPHGAPDPADRGRDVEGAGAGRVRLVPPGVDPHLPRHVPRAGDAARVHARGDVRRLPRRARHLPEGATRGRPCRRRAWCRPAGSATPARTTSFAQYDPHADRHNRARNPLLFYASKFMEALLIGVFAFFGIHTALWASRAVKPGQARSSRPDGGPRSEE